MLQLAVYHNHLEVVKTICENIPTADIVFAGKIPPGSNLANESETDLDADDKVKSSKKVRSLILFWALDRENFEMLRYLWTFDLFEETHWGINNLEFMLVLSNDLATSDALNNESKQELFSILLDPRSFSLALKSLPTLT
jgi:hypothetical protein